MSVRSTGERSKVKQSPGSVTMRAYWLVCGLPFLIAAEPPAEDKVKIVKLFEVPNYCEGIVFDHAGNGYISHGKVITKFTPDLRRSIWAETGAPNGHKVLADGTHLVCDGSQHAVLHLDANGKILGQASAA